MTQAYTQNFTEVHELVGFAIDTWVPATYFNLNYFSMSNHQRGVAILMVGEMAQGSTLDLTLYQATDAAGTGRKVIPGKAITQLSQAAGDGNDIVCIEVRTEELDVDGGFSYIGGEMVVAGGNVEAALVGFGGCSNYPPVPVTYWTEIVL